MSLSLPLCLLKMTCVAAAAAGEKEVEEKKKGEYKNLNRAQEGRFVLLVDFFSVM